MDGNGRWAKARGLPRTMGHRRGVEALRDAVRAVGQLGIEVLTLFAFSSENWRRPQDEVSELMSLLKIFIRRDLAELHREGVRVHVRPLAWGDQDAARRILHEFRPTHLLCSDLVYFPDLLAPLLHTLLDVTDRVPDAQVVIAYKIRSLTKEQPFWTALGVWFDMAWTQCSTGPDQPLAPFGSHASHFVHKPPCDAQGDPVGDASAEREGHPGPVLGSPRRCRNEPQ